MGGLPPPVAADFQSFMVMKMLSNYATAHPLNTTTYWKL
jgi:hypothetical protein